LPTTRDSAAYLQTELRALPAAQRYGLQSLNADARAMKHGSKAVG
jgi:hypothetical protein